MNIKTINQKIRELHLNKNYIFIAGGFASAFYSSLTNKNKTIEYDNINLYYIDFDNLYEYSKHSKPIMKCENTNNIIKKIETYSNIDSYNRMLYEIAFLTSKTKNSIDMDILHSIQLLFNSYDLSCCKIAFVIKNNYLEFYIHTDYYLNIVNVCGHSMFHTGLRIDKYKKRGYQIDKYTTCCSCSYDFNREQDNNYIYYDNLEYDE
jgi:hypothetical protein